MASFDAELDEIVTELHGLVERLDDLAIQALRDALARGEQRRPELERRITRARNALLRAVPLLRAGNGEDPGESE